MAPMSYLDRRAPAPRHPAVPLPRPGRRARRPWPAQIAALLLGALPLAAMAAGTLVRITTNFGAFTIELENERAPLTTANFLRYVHEGHYTGTIFHRVVPGFVIQGGGFVWDDATSQVSAVPSRGSLMNEFSASRPNRRGTIAMAKLGGDPNSATSQ